MKEAVFEIFFSFFVKDGVPQGFFVQCCVYVCTNIYTRTDIRVCLLEKVHAPPPPQQHPTEATRRSKNEQTDARPPPGSASLFFFFLLTVAVFAVVLCGVRSHHPRLPLRPVLKSDPPHHAYDEGWKAFPACGKEGSDVVR